MQVGVNNTASVRISVHCTSNQLFLTISICSASITLPTFFFKNKNKQNLKILPTPTAATLKQNIPYSKSQLLFTSINQKLAFFRRNSWTVRLMNGKNKLPSLCCLVFYALIPRKHTEGLRLRRGATAIMLSPWASCLIPTSEPTVEALRELNWDLKWKAVRHKRNGVQPGKKECLLRSGRSGSWGPEGNCSAGRITSDKMRAVCLESNVNAFKEVSILFFFFFWFSLECIPSL